MTPQALWHWRYPLKASKYKGELNHLVCLMCVKTQDIKQLAQNNCNAKTGWSELQTLKSQGQLCHSVHIITLQHDKDESGGRFHF